MPWQNAGAMRDMKKKITLALEVVNYLVNKVSKMVNDTNKVLLMIGMGKQGEGLKSCARIVDKMAMEMVGFTTKDTPEDYDETVKEPYIKCAVKASEFCAYLSALSQYSADIICTFTGKSFDLCVDGQADISLPCVAESEIEAPLSNKGILDILEMNFPNGKFLDAVKSGGFCAETGEDISGIGDRVLFSFFVNKKRLNIYSAESNGSRLAASSVEIASIKKDGKDARVNMFLNEKLGTIAGEDEKQAFMKSVKEADAAGRLEIATKNGYSEDMPYDIAVPMANILTLQKLLDGEGKDDTISLKVTSRYLMVASKNVVATFLISDKAISACRNLCDKFNNHSWTCGMLIDKEKMVQALSIIKLSATAKTQPLTLQVEKGKIVLKDANGNTTTVPVVSMGGKAEGIVRYFQTSKLMTVLSKFTNGNVCLALSAEPKMPLQIRNGDLNGSGTTAITYLVGLSVKPAPAKEDSKVETSEEETADEE